tara:strand:+ start:492 stop:731 length:240 start_codon:yes stop_codon:yes gene_type:complete
MNKNAIKFLSINCVVIVAALLVYNFTKLPFFYSIYPVPLAFLASLVLTVPRSQRIIRFFIWSWLILYFGYPVILLISNF